MDLLQPLYPPRHHHRIPTNQNSAPPWEESDSSLDPVDDLSDYALHGLGMPPADWQAAQDAAAEEIAALEALRDAGPDPELAARVAERRALVAGKGPKELAWLKLKAYHRAARRLRAARAGAAAVAEGAEGGQQQRQQGNSGNSGGEAPSASGRREAYLAAKGAPLDVVPAALIDMTPAEAAARAAAEIEAARAAEAEAEGAGGGAGGGGEGGGGSWLLRQVVRRQRRQEQEARAAALDPGYLAADATRDPRVVGALAAAFSAALGADVAPPPGSAAAKAAERAATEAAVARAGGAAAVEARAAELAAEVASLRRDAEELLPWEAAVRAAAAAPRPHAAQFTPEHEERLRRQRALARHRRARSGAFWLALLGAVGTGAWRWWQQRRDKQRRAAAAAEARAARRAGGGRAAAARAGSLASSEATLPAVLEA